MGSRTRSERRTGFTILEVMIAVFVLGIVIGGLLEYVGKHLARLADARREIEAAREAESRVRDLRTAARDGIVPELGRTEGTVDAPYDYLRWELIIEEDALPRPEGDEGPPSSSIFAEPGPVKPRRFQPIGGAAAVPESSLMRIELRVYPESVEEPERVPPFVAYLIRPAEPALLEFLAEQREPEAPPAAQTEAP